jgi:hypothetical protein
MHRKPGSSSPSSRPCQGVGRCSGCPSPLPILMSSVPSPLTSATSTTTASAGTMDGSSTIKWVPPLVGLLAAVSVACQCKTASPYPSQGNGITVANSNRPPSSIAGPIVAKPLGSTQASTMPKPEVVIRPVNFPDCPVLQNNQPGEDGIARCALDSDLIAQQDSSACFNVNRLLNADGRSLFTSEMVPPPDSVFVTDDKFKLYSCRGRPIAVLQGGRLFPAGSTPGDPCHGKTLLRRAYLVKDIQSDRQHDDVSLERAETMIAQIIANSPCRMRL